MDPFNLRSSARLYSGSGVAFEQGAAMSKSFFISGDRVMFLANGDGADLRYRAHSHTVPPQVQVPMRVNDRAETLCVIESGTFEFMVGGATGIVSAGNFVRIPAGIAYAYRNAGDEPAHILTRTQSAPQPREIRRVTIEIAAA
jgi:mannose-6-phosphate isomerase-like protein (cupin superfamily)